MSAFLDLPPIKLLHVDRQTLPPVPILPDPLEIPFILDEVGSFLNLPSIGTPVDALHAPRVAEATNPGDFNPLSQNLARRVSVDQTMKVTAGTGPVINSDGQIQLKDTGGVGQRGVTVSIIHAPLLNSDGNVQLPNVRPQDHTTSISSRPGGLPMEAKPDSQNVTMMTRVSAIALPVAKEVKADQMRPGRLPTSHIIK